VKALLLYQPSAEHRRALERVAPRANLVVAEGEDHARAEIAGADAVLGNRHLVQTLPAARRLRWVQTGSTGVNAILAARPPLGDAVLTCARGVYDDEVADHATALVLALARGLHRARDDQHARRWPRYPLVTLAGRRALILGWGGVGRGIARRLTACGMAVEAARRRHEAPPAPGEEGAVVHGPRTWRDALARTDVLVSALPLTAATRGIVGAAELAALPPGALVVNVGRGGTLDEDAVLAALRSGHLGGAGLDVLRDEPPAPDHPAWSEPGLLLTPHVARSLEASPRRWEPLFAENLRRFAAGEPLLGVVDVEAGY
jgi:phosphoglycerate dehydrogenase-like enzyme